MADLPWGHNRLLPTKLKQPAEQPWYAQAALRHGWSRAVLTVQMETQAHRRMGKALTNFAPTLPPPQPDLAQQVLKDPYTFDFLTLSAEARERELEHGLTVEYALRDVRKPIGVAEWKTRLVESLPKQLRGALPSVEDLERGLAGDKP